MARKYTRRLPTQHEMKPLPEFIQFKADMEKAGRIVAIYDDGTPFVHTSEPLLVRRQTTVSVDQFTETFDRATKCVFPVVEGHETVLNTL